MGLEGDGSSVVIKIVVLAVCLLPCAIGSDCDETITNKTGQIESPSYAANQTCVYTFSYKDSTPLYLVLQHVSLGINASLQFYNGSQQGHLIYALHTSTDIKKNPVVVYNLASHTILVYKSGDAGQGQQSSFSLNYTTEHSGCKVQMNSTSGVLRTPYFLPSDGNLECEYSVRNPDKVRSLVMSFEHENLDKGNLQVYDGGDEKSGTLVVNVTHSSPQIPDVFSKNNSLTLNFQLSTTKVQGFTAAYALLSSECTQSLTIPDLTTAVTVQSPGYPGNYSNDLNCRYVIASPAGSRITYKIVDLDLADEYDTITINDGGSKASPNIEKINKEPSGVFMTSGNALWVEFVTDEVNVARGFHLELRAIPYGGLYQSKGAFQLKKDNTRSPITAVGDDAVYYQLVTAPGLRLVVTFDTDALLYPTSVLEIHEGLQQSDPLIHNLTSFTPFYEVFSKANHMLIVAKGFLTNGTLGKQYFSARFHSEIQDNSRYYSVGEGDSYQLLESDVTDEATWYIYKPNNDLVALNLNNLVVKDNYVFSVYRGLSDKSLRILRYNATPEYVPTVYLESDTRICYMKSKNDSSVVQDSAAVILSAFYHVIPACSLTVPGMSGAISSPGFPDRYPYNARCDWTVSTPNDTLARLSFKQLSVGEGHSVAIQSYKNMTWQNVTTYTGSALPNDFLSDADSNATRVVFSSLFDGEQRTDVQQGFLAEYSVIDCGGSVGGNSGSISTPGYPKARSGATACVWLIQTPPPKSNKTTNVLSFSYDITNLDKKQEASLEFKDGGSSLASPMNIKIKEGKVKGKFSRYSAMIVEYTYTPSEDSSHGGFAFRLDYKTYTCKELCDNGVCMHDDWKCDYKDQCGDGSDEKGCSAIIDTKYRVKGWVVFIIILVTFAAAIAIACFAPRIYKRLRYRNYNELRDLMAPVPT